MARAVPSNDTAKILTRPGGPVSPIAAKPGNGTTVLCTLHSHAWLDLLSAASDPALHTTQYSHSSYAVLAMVHMTILDYQPHQKSAQQDLRGSGVGWWPGVQLRRSTAHIISYQISPLGSVQSHAHSRKVACCRVPHNPIMSVRNYESAPPNGPLPRSPPRLRMASSTFDLGSTRDSAPLTYLWIPSAIQESRDSRPHPCSYAYCSRKYYAIQFPIHELDSASSSLA